MSLAGCGSAENTTKKETAVSTESSAVKKDKQMKQMEKDLGKKGVEININSINDSVYFTREKGIDYDFFEMTFDVRNGPDEIFEIILELKGNISGKSKDSLYYEVSKGRIVESSLDNTNINEMARVLKSLDYSDKEILEFAQWYYNNKKEQESN